jgi:hypothetical protein
VSIREARLLELEGEWRRRRRRRGEARGAWARQEGDREGRGGFTPSQRWNPESYLLPVPVFCYVHTLAANILFFCGCVLFSVGTHQLVWVLWFYN